MIGAAALKLACNTILLAAYPNYPVYGNDTVDGIERPSFATDIIQNVYSVNDRYTREYSYSYVITFYEVTHDEAVCLGVVDTIREAFGSYVIANGSHAVIDTVEWRFFGQYNNQLQITIEFKPIVEIDTTSRESYAGLEFMEVVEAHEDFIMTDEEDDFTVGEETE